MSDDEVVSDPMEKVLAEVRDLRRLIERPAKKALDYKDVGDLMGLHHTTIRRMAKQPGFPQLREYQTDDEGRTVKRFVASEIDDWIARKTSRAS